MPRIAPKSGGMQRISIPKGTPKRVEAFDDLDI